MTAYLLLAMWFAFLGGNATQAIIQDVKERNMFMYVLSGKEKNEEGWCPLYDRPFSTKEEAVVYARDSFHLKEWIEDEKGNLTIKTHDRIYTITKEECSDDIKH